MINKIIPAVNDLDRKLNMQNRSYTDRKRNGTSMNHHTVQNIGQQPDSYRSELQLIKKLHRKKGIGHYNKDEYVQLKDILKE